MVAGMLPALAGPDQALALLVTLGANDRLVRHHALVAEAATELVDRLRSGLTDAFDRDLVLLGAALHDAGKIVHPRELQAPGHDHEAAGRALLIERGVAPTVARFCVTHAAWADGACTLEDLLVALADKLWKGTRDEALEARALHAIAVATGRPAWAVFATLDAICEAVAADGPARLARSLP